MSWWRGCVACVGSFDPAALSGAAAKQLVEEFAELKRLAGAGEMLAAGRVAQTGAWVGEDGAFRDIGAWMAHVAGTSVGRARATIETAERVASLPATAVALRAGVVVGGAGRRDRVGGDRRPTRGSGAVALGCVGRGQGTEAGVRQGRGGRVEGSGRAIRAGPRWAVPAASAPLRCGGADRDAGPDRCDCSRHGRAGPDRAGPLRRGPQLGSARAARGAGVRCVGADGRRLGDRGRGVERATGTGDGRVPDRPHGVHPGRDQAGRGVRDRRDRSGAGVRGAEAGRRRDPQSADHRRHGRAEREPSRPDHPRRDCGPRSRSSSRSA